MCSIVRGSVRVSCHFSSTSPSTPPLSAQYFCVCHDRLPPRRSLSPIWTLSNSGSYSHFWHLTSLTFSPSCRYATPYLPILKGKRKDRGKKEKVQWFKMKLVQFSVGLLARYCPCNNGHNGGRKHRCAALCHISRSLGVFDQDWGSTPCIGESLWRKPWWYAGPLWRVPF